MCMEKFDFISIGSGSSGRGLAAGLQRSGWKVAIVEKDVDHHFGGTCINTGCIPTKAIVESALHNSSLDSAKALEDKIVERIRSGTLRNVEEKVGVKVIHGEASFIDQFTIEVGGEKYSSDMYAIATGSEPSIPPIKGLNSVDYSTSSDLLHIDHVPKSILVIGGGRIGLELSQAFHNLGSEVTIFEGLPHLLPGEDEEIADAIKEHLMSLGIKIYNGRFVDAVDQGMFEGGKYKLSIYEGENKGDYYGDFLLVATGRKPRISGLNLEKIGVETERGVIKVDEYLRTTQKHIFAVGDVIGNPMFTNWAAFQGRLVLNNLRQSREETANWEKLRTPNMPRMTFVYPELAAVGLTEKEARDKYGDDVIVSKFYNKWLGKSMIVGDYTGFLKAIGRKGSNEILGVHLWGVRTGSIIQMIVLAMENNLGWSQLADMVYGHPVLVEGVEGLSRMMSGKVNADS